MTPDVERLAALTTFSSDAIVLSDAGGAIQWASPSSSRVLGFDADELTGARTANLIDPEDHDAWQTFERDVLGRPGVPLTTQFRCRRGDGSSRWVEAEARNLLAEPSVQAIVVRYRDATARRREDPAQQALRLAEAKYRTLVEQSLVSVFILQNDRFVYVNPTGARLLGHTVDELLAFPTAFVLIHEQDRGFVIDQLDRLGEPGRPTLQLTCRAQRKDGMIVQVEAFCAVSEFLGQAAVLITVLDISDRVRLEDQLRQAQKMEAVGRLAGGIAHDFNNLLAAIRGNAELMLHRVSDNAEMTSEMKDILEAADRAAGLTRQLLAFSRKQVLQPVPLDLNALIQGVSRMARRLMGTDVRLEEELATDLRQVLADPGQIEQVLLNLIVNARDAMPGGGRVLLRTANVALMPGAKEVVREGLQPGLYVRLSVADEGTGMDQATITRIFEPFFTTKEPGRGTGLGLSTVYGIVRQTGGGITVVSARDEGTTFMVYLPALAGDPVA
jgi:PAS domain S-box-containing protein